MCAAASSSPPPEMDLYRLCPEEAAAVEWVRTMVRDSGGKKVRHTECLLGCLVGNVCCVVVMMVAVALHHPLSVLLGACAMLCEKGGPVL